MYYSPVKSDKATIVTRVYRTMNVEGIASENSILLELEMVYKEGWLIDSAKILTEIKVHRSSLELLFCSLKGFMYKLIEEC